LKKYIVVITQKSFLFQFYPVNAQA